jgi:hypothetical protein
MKIGGPPTPHEMAPDPSLAVGERDLQPALPTISINNREIEIGVSRCLVCLRNDRAYLADQAKAPPAGLRFKN